MTNTINSNHYISDPLYQQGSKMDELANAAKKIGEGLSDVERQLIAEYSKGENERNQGLIQALTIKYNHMRTLQELFMTLVRSMFETTMSLIRKLAVR